MFTKKSATPSQKIIFTISRVLIKRKINAIHGEAKNYVFRTSDGVWHTAKIDFVNELANLGRNNFKNMLDDDALKKF